MSTRKIRSGTLSKGLPSNVDAERSVLGSILLDDAVFIQTGTLEPDDFSLEKHRRIFRRMGDLSDRSEKIDRVTVANELMKFGELEACDGLSYLVSLDDGLPQRPNLDSYVRIVKDKAVLRRIIFASQHMMNRCLQGQEAPDDILAGAEETLLRLRDGPAYENRIENIPRLTDCPGGQVKHLYEPLIAAGCILAFTGESAAGKSTFATWLAGKVKDAGTPALILDRENPLSAVTERFGRLRLEDGPLLRILCGWCGSHTIRPADPDVINLVKRTEPKPLILLDSKSAFFKGDDENDAAQTRSFFNPLRRLADMGATIVLLHHSGKSDSSRYSRGSSDFAISHFTGVWWCDGNVSRLACAHSPAEQQTACGNPAPGDSDADACPLSPQSNYECSSERG